VTARRNVTISTNLILLLAGFCGPAHLAAQKKPSPREVAVPFVGCKSDGQVGPIKAPRPGPTPKLPPEVAGLVAYYRSDVLSIGALAPRGWICFGLYGSGGSELRVQPPKAVGTATSVPDQTEHPGVVVSYDAGNTSGRTEVAEVIARVFPAHIGYTEAVLHEIYLDEHDFPRGPYPKDVLTYKGTSMVEFETASGEEGLGTRRGLRSNSSPISGVAILLGLRPPKKDVSILDMPDLLLLSIRLPASLRNLIPIIIRQVEQEAALEETQQSRR